jgi:flavin-dependent dehydrogenase
MNFIVEKEKRTKVIDNVEVLVAGGGTAGAIAAIAAARRGFKVMIVEQFSSLGGSATEGLVTPLMNTNIEGNPMCSSISDEINNRIIGLGFAAEDDSNNKGHFDPLMLKLVLEEMAAEAGVKILYYTYICDVYKEDDKIAGVIIENKGGRSAILASRVIDCTGDADVAYLCKVPMESGQIDTGKNQPMSVRYMMFRVCI